MFDTLKEPMRQNFDISALLRHYGGLPFPGRERRGRVLADGVDDLIERFGVGVAVLRSKPENGLANGAPHIHGYSIAASVLSPSQGRMFTSVMA